MHTILNKETTTSNTQKLGVLPRKASIEFGQMIARKTSIGVVGGGKRGEAKEQLMI